MISTGKNWSVPMLKRRTYATSAWYVRGIELGLPCCSGERPPCWLYRRSAGRGRRGQNGEDLGGGGPNLSPCAGGKNMEEYVRAQS
jgi:hypothetical protein